MLEGHDGAAASARAEGFREALAARPLMVDGIELPVTISIGWAEFDLDTHGDLDGFYRAADRAVYRAKREGRNRVCADPPLPVSAADCVVEGGNRPDPSKP